jgi:predicted acetyltransferase
MYIGCARTKEDLNQAINIATKTFRSKGNFDLELINKRFLMFPNNVDQIKDVIIIADDMTGVIGACFLIDRFFYRGAFLLKGTFFSSICISEECRGKGLSKLLLNFAITEAEKRGSDFAVLIARRAADFFYNQFNFWGLAQYNKIQYEPSSDEGICNRSLFFDAKKEDIEKINEIYVYTYSSLLGSCERTNNYWFYLLKRVNQQNFKVIVSKLNDKVNGYIIYSGAEVYEFASDSNTSCLDMLNNFGIKFSFNKLTLHCSSKHSILKELQNIDFIVTKRQCSYGGHMVRIINHQSILKVLEAECRSRFEQLNLTDYEEEVDGACMLKLCNNNISLNLLDSPYTFKSTCFLMGVEYLSVAQKGFSIFEPKPFNVLLFDQI